MNDMAEAIGGLIGCAIISAIYAVVCGGILALGVWIVVRVLQVMGVL